MDQDIHRVPLLLLLGGGPAHLRHPKCHFQMICGDSCWERPEIEWNSDEGAPLDHIQKGIQFMPFLASQGAAQQPVDSLPQNE